MTWVVVVIVIVAFDLLTVVLIRRFVGRTWQSMVDRFPPRDPAPDAVTRNFQSFRLGVINLGWSVHVAADESYLHLRPARFVRLFGCRPLSIPWDAISVVRRSSNGRWATVRLAGAPPLEGPAWCLDLAGEASG